MIEPLRCSRALALVLVALSGAGCTKFAEISAGTIITCASTADCPSGRVCNRAGHCVEAATADTTPPDFASSVVVSPSRLRAGQPVTITIHPDEPLEAPPRVTLGLEPLRELRCAAASATTFSCPFTPDGSENSGRDGRVWIDVRMTDASGNETVRMSAASLFLDFTPPVLAASSVEPGDVPLGGVIQVFFAVDEDLGARPVLVASRPLQPGDQTRFPLDAQGSTRNYLWTHPVEHDASGPVAFTVELVDAVGNATTDVPVGSVAIDVDRPTISGLAVSPARIRDTGTVTVAFDTEATVTAVAASIGGRDMACPPPPPPGTHFTCTWQMHPSDLPAGTEAAQSVVVTLTDLAGNRASASGSTVFDFRAPRVAAASVSYAAPDASPIPTVARAGVGARVTVTVLADEALDPETLPSLTAAGLAFTHLAPSSTPTSAVFEATLADTIPDGEYVATVTWVDVAQNRIATSTGLPPVKVKTSAPALSVDQTALVFVRSPIGSGADESLGGYTIPAGAYYAVEPVDPLSAGPSLPAGSLLLAGGVLPSAVVVQDTGAASGAQTLGVLRPVGNAFPRRKLNSSDLTAVYLVGVDDAGNRSPAVKIQNAEWVATSYAGALGTSPHQVAWTPATVAARDQPVQFTPVMGTSTAQADGAAVLAQSSFVWQQRTFDAAPGARQYQSVAYDAARGRVVMFGGRTAASMFTADLWSWDGVAWTDETPVTTGPAPRCTQAMAYDSRRGRLVIAGGYQFGIDTGSRPVSDVWAWDGARWEQLPLSAVGDVPFMTYDTGRDVLVLFTNPASITEFDGTSSHVVSPAGSVPTTSGSHALAYDPRRARTVLVESSGATSRTWEWDGTTWFDASPAGTVAPPSGPIAYDVLRGRLVLVASGRTWERSGTTWSDVTPAGAAAPDGVLAYDAARHRVVLVESPVNSVGSNVTWEWDGVRWRDVSPNGTSPAVQGSMAHDSLRAVTLLVGGSETWEWNGTRWRNVTPAGAHPTGVGVGGTAAYDSLRDRTLALAGGRTWEWNGASWADVTPSAGGPSGLVAYDAWRHRVVANSGGGTWLWNGSAWSAAAPAVTIPSGNMGFDAARGVTVLSPSGLGGYAWEWDGTSWTTVVDGLHLLDMGQFTFNSARRRIVTFSGSIPQYPKYPILHEWGGAGWSHASSAVSPSGRDYAALAYQPDLDRTVLFGGTGRSSTFYDTWVLDCSTTRTPAVQFDVSTAALGVPTANVSTLSVRAYAGGTQLIGASTVSGALLLAWVAHVPGWGPGWLPLASNTTALAASEPYLPAPSASLIPWSSATAADARRLITASDGRMAFQVRPQGPAGTESAGASVGLDSIEVRVRYAVPP